MPRLTGSRCQCPTCGDYFNGLDAFDRHRIGNYAKPGQSNTRQCLTVAEMIAARFIRNAAGCWMTDSREQRAARRSAAGFSAPRGRAAMVTQRVGTGAPQIRTGATP
jgi:hypothetical protein